MNDYSVRNQMLLQKYPELGKDLFTEPKNEKIVGIWAKTNSHRFKIIRKESQSKIQTHRALVLYLCLDVWKIKTKNKIMNFKDKPIQKNTVLLSQINYYFLVTTIAWYDVKYIKTYPFNCIFLLYPVEVIVWKHFF